LAHESESYKSKLSFAWCEGIHFQSPGAHTTTADFSAPT
jgi:hypothetical protein